jgi:hypothetical protein
VRQDVQALLAAVAAQLRASGATDKLASMHLATMSAALADGDDALAGSAIAALWALAPVQEGERGATTVARARAGQAAFLSARGQHGAALVQLQRAAHDAPWLIAGEPSQGLRLRDARVKGAAPA